MVIVTFHNRIHIIFDYFPDMKPFAKGKLRASVDIQNAAGSVSENFRLLQTLRACLADALN